MQDKKRQILEAAIRCFARKGFHATSIQEIADEISMGKGSIYFYFKSKDDLLLSVFEYYVEMLFNRMMDLPDEWTLPPREKLAMQLERQFGFFREHLDFMRMLLKEPLAGQNPRIKQMMLRIRARGKVWNFNHLMAIYGRSGERYFGDASMLLSGMVGQYFETILFEGNEFDDKRLSRYLVQRLDDLMTGIERAGEAPILPNPDIASLRKLAGIDSTGCSDEIKTLEEMAESITTSKSRWDEHTRSDLLAAVRMLIAEVDKPLQHNHLLVRGMIALLKQNGMEEWREPLERMEQRIVKEIQA